MNVTGEIRWYLGEDCANLRFSEDRYSFYVDSVLVPASFRRQGIGSQLLGHILSLADAMDKDVFLSARPIGPNDPERLWRLVHYYERFGFVITDEGLTSVQMKRPRPSQRGA